MSQVWMGQYCSRIDKDKPREITKEASRQEGDVKSGAQFSQRIYLGKLGRKQAGGSRVETRDAGKA